MQRRDDAGRGSQILRIVQQFQPRVVHTRKEQPAHPLDIGLPKIVELVRHGEDDVVVITGQQARLLPGQPAFDLHPGILRTHPVPTGVLPDAFHMPLGTGLYVTSEHGRATHQDRPDGD